MNSNEILVICEHCSSVIPVEDAEPAGERVGPDLIAYNTYVCFDCLEEMEDEEDL